MLFVDHCGLSGLRAGRRGVCLRLHDQLGQAEIKNLRLAARGDENVPRLDVAMDDALRVRGIERIGNLHRQIEQLFQLYGSSFDAVLKRLPAAP
jgi:hypothetical protein